MSSNDSATDVAQLMKAGAVEYMVKPVGRSRLQSLSRHVRLDVDTGAVLDSHGSTNTCKDSTDKCPDATDVHIAHPANPASEPAQTKSEYTRTSSPQAGRPAISMALLDAVQTLTESIEPVLPESTCSKYIGRAHV